MKRLLTLLLLSSAGLALAQSPKLPAYPYRGYLPGGRYYQSPNVRAYYGDYGYRRHAPVTTIIVPVQTPQNTNQYSMPMPDLVDRSGQWVLDEGKRIENTKAMFELAREIARKKDSLNRLRITRP